MASKIRVTPAQLKQTAEELRNLNTKWQPCMKVKHRKLFTISFRSTETNLKPFMLELKNMYSG